MTTVSEMLPEKYTHLADTAAGKQLTLAVMEFRFYMKGGVG